MPLQPPVQRRSRKTLERLVSATIDLLEDRRPADVSVQDIVSIANSSVGSFYARFKSKEDLLEYVRTRMWLDATDRWRTAYQARRWDDLALGPLVRGLVRLFDQVEGLHVRARHALGGTASDPAALAFNQEVEAGAVQLLLDRHNEIGHLEPTEAAHFAVRLCHYAVRNDNSSQLEPDAHQWNLDELATALTGYLRGSVLVEPQGEVEFFDVWGD